MNANAPLPEHRDEPGLAIAVLDRRVRPFSLVIIVLAVGDLLDPAELAKQTRPSRFCMVLFF